MTAVTGRCYCKLFLVCCGRQLSHTSNRSSRQTYIDRYIRTELLRIKLVTSYDYAYHSRSNLYYYSAPVGERSIAISLSVCVCVSLPVREHISGTAGPICTKFVTQIPVGRGSVLLWRRCDTLCTSGFMDDVTFGRGGPYGDVWRYRGGV